MSIKLTTEDFIKRAIIIHKNEYDYSLVNYNGSKHPVKIICNKHGVFEQRSDHHLKGGECKFKSIANKRIQSSKDKFIPKSNKAHNNKYDYSLVEYQHIETKVIIICPKHGQFKQTPNSHLRGHGCPKCKSSKGEQRVERWLINNNFKFTNQKRFPDCKDKYTLPFDFYLPEHNTLIEYDGEQHVNPFRIKGKEKEMLNKLKTIQLHDKIKTQYCIDNDIKLIRIPHTQFKNINTILYHSIQPLRF